jgi:hypothetical protein
MFPKPPSKIVAFNSGPVAAHDIGRQFDEHARSMREVLSFLRAVVRDDGVLRNGTIGPEQLRPELPAELAKRIVAEAEWLLTEVRHAAAGAAQANVEARQHREEIEARFRAAASTSAALRRLEARVEARARRVQEIEQGLDERVEARISTSLATGALGPNAGGFYGVDAQGAAATAQDYAQVAIDWAEHMPDTIPPNTLAINAITGQHWSSRWWASKSANAFGMLAWWYMGAWPQPGPPTTPLTATGDPIPVGAMYFDETFQVMMVWNGSTWINTSRPMAASTASLYYLSNAAQTVFPLSTPDRNGKTFTFNQVAAATEGMFAYVNGVRLEPTYDYTVDTVNSVVTFTRSVTAQALVVFDFLAPKASLAPSGSAQTVMLTPIVPDGTTTVFSNLTVASTSQPINVAHSEELFVSVDGIPQQPGASYNATAATITFTEAPAATALVYIVWFGPPVTGSGGGTGTMASQNANAVAITGGAINGTLIGQTTPAAGGFTALTSTSGALNGSIGAATPSTGAFTTLGASGAVTLSPGNASVTLAPTGSGTVTVNPATPGHVDNTIIGATVPAAASITSLNGGPLAGMRNRIINGHPVIDQRHAGASWVAPASTPTYGVDRWQIGTSQGGKFTAAQGPAGVPGFNKWFGVNVTAAYTPAASDYAVIAQAIEGFNIVDLGFGAAGAQPVTLSFWVYTSVAGTHSGAITNGGNTRSYPFTFSVAAANTWTKIAVTIPGDVVGTWAVDNTAGLLVNFNLGTGTTYSGPAGAWAATNYVGATGSVQLATALNAVFYITGVQLEPGTIATPFERRLYGAELALCQRYYQFLGGAASCISMYGYMTAGNPFINTLSYPTMRAVPTATQTGTWGSANLASTVFAAMYIGVNAIAIQTAGASVTGTAQINNAAGAGITLSAEL